MSRELISKIQKASAHWLAASSAIRAIFFPRNESRKNKINKIFYDK